jgi:RNase P subunit RPR2
MQRRPDQEERVTTLVCLECGDESDEARRWRAYLDEEDVLVYCAHCATREFGPY